MLQFLRWSLWFFRFCFLQKPTTSPESGTSKSHSPSARFAIQSGNNSRGQRAEKDGNPPARRRGQPLMAANMNVSVLNEYKDNPENFKNITRKISNILPDAIADVRTLSHQMMPNMLIKKPFDQCLERPSRRRHAETRC